MKKVYLLTIVDESDKLYTGKLIFNSVYSDKVLAQHYMLEDIVDQFKKGKIMNLDGIDLKKDVYVNNNIIWRIEEVNFFNGII